MKRTVQAMIAVALMIVVALCVFTACNSSAQSQNGGSDSSTVEPPVGGNDGDTPQEEEPLIAIDSLWDESFGDTSFADDLQTAYSALCETALPGLNAAVENVSYDSSSGNVNMSVSYYEYDAVRTGNITFSAPDIVRQLESDGAKAAVLSAAGYSETTQIKESEADEAKIAVTAAIERVRAAIEQAIASLNASDLSVTKEEIRFITYDEIYDEYFSDLSFDEDIRTDLQLLLDTSVNSCPILMWYRVDAEGHTIKLRTDTTSKGSYNGDDSEPKEMSYCNQSGQLQIRDMPQIISDATTDVKGLVFAQIGVPAQTEVPVNKTTEVRDEIGNAAEDIRSSLLDAFLSIDFYDINTVLEDHASFGNAMDQVKAMEAARKLLPDKEILCCYVDTPYSRGFDDAPENSGYTVSGPTSRYFIPTSGYITGFNVNILYLEGDDIMRYYARIVVPWYTDVSGREYWEGFLQGVTSDTGSVITSSSTRYRYKVTTQSTAFDCKAEEWLGAVEHSGEIIEEDCSYIIRNDKAYLLSVKNLQTDTYSVPSELGGKEVVGWWGPALTYSNTVAEIEVPDTIEFLMAAYGNGGIFGSNVKYVRLPQSIKSIGRRAFFRCSELTAIYYDGTVEQWHEIIKKSEWNAETGDYVVICSDGTLTKKQANGTA